MDFNIALRTRTLTELRMRGFWLPPGVLTTDLRKSHNWELLLFEWLRKEGFKETKINPHRLPCCEPYMYEGYPKVVEHRQTAAAHTTLTSRFCKELAIKSDSWYTAVEQPERLRIAVEEFLRPYLGFGGYAGGWASVGTFNLAAVLFDKIKLTCHTTSFIVGQSYLSFGPSPVTGECGGYDFALETCHGYPTASLRWNEPFDLPIALEKFLPYLQKFCRTCQVFEEARIAAGLIMQVELPKSKEFLTGAVKLIEADMKAQSSKHASGVLVK